MAEHCLNIVAERRTGGSIGPPHDPIGAQHDERIGEAFDDALLGLQQPLNKPGALAERLGEELHLAHHLRR